MYFLILSSSEAGQYALIYFIHLTRSISHCRSAVDLLNMNKPNQNKTKHHGLSLGTDDLLRRPSYLDTHLE